MLRLYNLVDLSSILAFSHDRKQYLTVTCTNVLWVSLNERNTTTTQTSDRFLIVVALQTS